MYPPRTNPVKHFFKFFIILLISFEVGFYTQSVFAKLPESKTLAENDFSVPIKCQYKGKVSPKKFQEKVKRIYTDMCIWWGRTFPSKPLREDIALNNVYFSKTVKDKELPGGSGEREYGLFWRLDKKGVNKVFVRYPIPENDNTWRNTSAVVDGILAHEIFHFFKKSCCFDSLKELREVGDKINVIVLESSAYWAQDQFLRRNYGKGLLEVMVIAEDEKNFNTKIMGFYEADWRFLSMISYPKLLFNSVFWFDEAPQETLDRLINGYYLMNDNDHY